MIKNRIHSGSMPVSMEMSSHIEGCSDNMSSYDPGNDTYTMYNTWKSCAQRASTEETTHVHPHTNM